MVYFDFDFFCSLINIVFIQFFSSSSAEKKLLLPKIVKLAKQTKNDSYNLKPVITRLHLLGLKKLFIFLSQKIR